MKKIIIILMITLLIFVGVWVCKNKTLIVNEDIYVGLAKEYIVSIDKNIKEEKIRKVSLSDVNIPILMYHSISDANPKNSLLVPIEQFRNEIKWLKDNGYTAMLMEDVINAMNTGVLPEKPIAITFDDGYTDNYTEAFPILKENNMKATFFVITNNTDKGSDYMSSAMLKEMYEWGMGIENHTSSHIELNKASNDDKIIAIKEAKDFLKDKLNIESKYLCYPVGRYDSETIEVAKSLGIEAAVTTEPGISKSENGYWSLKRVRINPMNLEEFIKKLQ